MSPKKVPTRDAPVKLDRQSEALDPVKGTDDEVIVGHGYRALPYDYPAVVYLARVMGEFNGSEKVPAAVGLFGHRLRLNYIGLEGHEVEVKTFRNPPGIQVLVNGEEVYRWMSDGSEIPVGPTNAAAKQSQEDGAMAEVLDLRPGEFVEQDEETGEIIVTNEDDPIMDDDDNDPIIEPDEEEIQWED